MRISHFFIDRPIFAAVLSVLLTIAGAIAQGALPVSEYPEIAPPTVNISATYPGASAEVIAATVATPIEQEVNGVDDMLYITSQSTGDGRVSIDVVFKAGVNIDHAQVLVQNRVAIAKPRLPEEVRRLRRDGEKSLARSDDGRSSDLARRLARPAIYFKLRDALCEGRAGSRRRRRQREHFWRAGLFDAGLARSGEDRRARSDGRRGRRRAARRPISRWRRAPSISRPRASPGRVPACRCKRWDVSATPAQFGEIVVRADPDGYIRVHDIARVELGALDYTVNAYLNRDTATALVIFQRPGSNALATAAAVKAQMELAKKDFPCRSRLLDRLQSRPNSSSSRSMRSCIRFTKPLYSSSSSLSSFSRHGGRRLSRWSPYRSR